MTHVGNNILLQNILLRHAESFIAARLASGLAVGTVNKDYRVCREKAGKRKYFTNKTLQ